MTAAAGGVDPRPAPEQSVMVVAGTRPEGVKVAPLVLALRERAEPVLLLDSGQQPGRVAEAVAPFGLAPDAGLAVARRTGSLNELLAAVAAAMEEQLSRAAPAAVVVQGDTTTAMAAALAAHHRGIPVVHLEAGLRTGDPAHPFPEETNRRVIDVVASLHLAPTARARAALEFEGIAPTSIVVTGNTGIDALLAGPDVRASAPRSGGGRRLVVTVHRREAWGDGVASVLRCVRRLVEERADLEVTVVAHPNPEIARAVREGLALTPRCVVLPPQGYRQMLALLVAADVVLTDSGGIQEEAPTLGVPAVVARWRTERPEGVDAGWADLVGLDEHAILDALRRRLDAPHPAPATVSPYGDGHAAERAAQAIRWMRGLGARPEDWVYAAPPVAAPARERALPGGSAGNG